MKSFADFKKSIASVGKKKEERKPQKAMDAGARGRRMLQRREYASKVSAFSHDELKDHYKNVVKKHNQDFLNKKYPDSGFDLYAPKNVTFTDDNKVVFIDYLIKSQMVYYNGENEKMENSAFYMYPRSSFSKTPLILGNHVGVIDSGYRGHLMGAFKYFSSCDYPDEYIVEKHQRLLQVCHPSLCPIFVKILDSDNFEETERGSGGFGSTGQ